MLTAQDCAFRVQSVLILMLVCRYGVAPTAVVVVAIIVSTAAAVAVIVFVVVLFWMTFVNLLIERNYLLS